MTTCAHEHGDDIQRLLTLIIAPQANVMGEVIAERGAVIWISRSAQVGAIHGDAEVHWYEGTTPPGT